MDRFVRVEQMFCLFSWKKPKILIILDLKTGSKLEPANYLPIISV